MAVLGSLNILISENNQHFIRPSPISMEINKQFDRMLKKDKSLSPSSTMHCLVKSQTEFFKIKKK